MANSSSDAEWLPLEPSAAAEFDDLRQEIRRSVDVLPLPEPGSVIDGRFEVLRELGKGGFGIVFEVRHMRLGQRFALKLLAPLVANRDGWRERFREEARATSQIGHPNIVFITDFGECPDFGSYFAMEYLDGESLDVILAERTLPPAQVAELVRQIADALDTVHARGIVHCDLKPGNVFRLRGEANVGWKLLDFGASSIVMSVYETHTLYGTPRYMAPEHAIGAPVDRRADVFSLGLLCYEAVTGAPPWATKTWYHASPRWRGDHPPALPSSLARGIPRGWDDAIMRALSLAPDDRPPRAGELAAELLHALDERPPTRPHVRALAPETVLRVDDHTALRRSILPGEFFVLSRIQDGVTYAELTRLCTGLPFDLEETLQSMMERGYLVPSPPSEPPDARRPPRRRDAVLSESFLETTEVEIVEPVDVDAILAHVRRLDEEGNFLGALETLNTSLATWPEHALLHFARGTLLERYGQPAGRVAQAYRRAAQLEPDNAAFRIAAERMENNDA